MDGLFEPIFQILLVALRVGALWMFFPVLSHASIPMVVRLAGALTLSLALRPLALPHLPPWTLHQLPQAPELLFFVVQEFLIGAGMGLVAKWIFYSAVAASEWVGTQMGFSQGSLVDPDLGQQQSAWADFNQWIMIMLFLGLGGHWFMIQAIAESYSFNFTDMFSKLSNPRLATEFWIEIGRQFFFWMLKLAGPMAVVLLLLQAALGVLSRFIPQINMWLVSIPLTIGIGVFIFTLLSPMYGDALGSLTEMTRESHFMWLRFLGTR